MKTHFDLKKLLIFSASTLAGITYGQVGVNTQTPNTIFDINARRNPSGELTSNDQTFGLQAPRVSREELTNNTASYGSSQNGALIYVTNISGGTSIGQREYMISIGYYYFDAVANRWQKVMNGSAGAVYTAANGTTMYGSQIKLGGALTEGTTISNVSTTNKLSITGTGVDAINFDSNTLSIDATNNRIGIGNTSPSEKLDVAGNGKFSQKVTIGSSWTGAALSVDNKIASEPIMAISGTGLNRRITVLDNGNTGIGTQAPSEKLDVYGNIKSSENVSALGNGLFGNKLTVGSTWTGSAFAVDNKVASEPIMAVSGTGMNRRITVLDNGNTAIGNQTPSEKLDVAGNARLRSVPAGTLLSSDDYLAIASDGTLKKVDVNLPALGLFARTTGTNNYPSNGNINSLNFENTVKRDGNFIATSGYQNRFIAVKDGLYTVEVWAQFSTAPVDTNTTGRGCTLQVSSNAGNTVQRLGDRWEGGEGTTGLTKTFILNANQEIAIYTRCKRVNEPSYGTGPDSTILITYTPIQ